jgi:hypothetical protein
MCLGNANDAVQVECTAQPLHAARTSLPFYGAAAVVAAVVINRGGQLWLPDLAWASGIMGFTDAALTSNDCSQSQQQQQKQQQKQQQQQEERNGSADTQPPVATAAAEPAAADVEQQQQQQVTWRRVHAMGPRRLLQQQMQLGLLASLSTTQWSLDYAVDANMAGQLPLLAVPSFSQPQPYPLLLMQQAPQLLGGGVLLHVWLDAAEVPLLQQAVSAQGGL